MKGWIVSSSIVVAASALAYDASDFSSLGRRDEPMPTGHAPGKDNGEGEGLHYAGEDCGICHTPGGKAETTLDGKDVVFSMAGTLYADRMATRPVAGAEIVLEDIEGNVVSMTTNAVGNFWTTAPLASNPVTIASHGGQTHHLYERDASGALITPTDPADSRSWLYKTWMRLGDQVIPMVTVAPVGGSTGTTPRMGCSMHHSPLGSSGALWISREPTLERYPKASLSLRQHVLPIFAAKCAPCHIPGSRLTRLVTESDVDAQAPTTIDYSGGYDLTSYHGSDYTVTAADGSTQVVHKKGIKDAVDTVRPDLSTVLTKTLLRPPGAQVVHAGGSFFAEGDPDYQAVKRWIAEGALEN